MVLAIFGFISCDQDAENDNSEISSNKSIIGRVLDNASQEPLTNCTLVLENTENSYLSSTDDNGYFEFREIVTGDYDLITKKAIVASEFDSISDISEIVDSLGTYSTDSTNWGRNILSSIFSSAIGQIELPDVDDYSEIAVTLLGTDKTALTTNKGFFRFDFLLPGTYDLKFEKDGYRDIKIIDIELSQGTNFSIDTTMQTIYKLVGGRRECH